MRGGTARKIEKGVMTASAAALAGAVGFAAFRALEPFATQPGLSGFTAGAMGLAFLLCGRVLERVVTNEPRFNVPIFDIGAVRPFKPDELLLTDADRVEPVQPAATADEPLELDDILREVGSDARVVRLFDPAVMPTPGQLKTRIDQHLDGRAPPAASPDASQALVDALTELRQSFR